VSCDSIGDDSPQMGADVLSEGPTERRLISRFIGAVRFKGRSALACSNRNMKP
jgi:hypothetical protein